jgi:hypothetical protein
VSKNQTLGAVVRSEWIKFRSVRSSLWGMATFLLLTIGLGVLITVAVRSNWSHSGADVRIGFDPTSTSLASTAFAQFAVGVIGVLFITAEYTSGSIRTTFAAVPNRFRVISAKLLILITSILVTGEAICIATFLTGQSIFKGVVPTASLTNGSVLRSVLLAGLYLTLAAMIGFAIGLVLRHSAGTISVYVGVFLILPLITFALPQSWQDHIDKFEPSTLGREMMAPFPAQHMYGAWTATLILFIYAAVLLAIGVTFVQRRDA